MKKWKVLVAGFDTGHVIEASTKAYAVGEAAAWVAECFSVEEITPEKEEEEPNG